MPNIERKGSYGLLTAEDGARGCRGDPGDSVRRRRRRGPHRLPRPAAQLVGVGHDAATAVEAARHARIAEAPPTKAALESLNDPRTKVVQLPYYLPDWNNISKADNEPGFQKVLLGRMTAKAFCDKVADELNAAQADWKKHQR